MSGDFGPFLKALAARWLGLILGAVVCVLVVGGYERFSGTVVGETNYVAITIAFVALEGGFLAFASERQRRLRLEAVPAAVVTTSDDPLAAMVVENVALETGGAAEIETPKVAPNMETPAPVELRVEPPAAPATPAARVFLDVGPRFLIDLCADQSPSGLDAAVAPYLGKWLGVTLLLTQLQDYPPGNCIFVNGKSSDSHGEVACTFDRKAWLAHLLARKTGDAIRVAGELANIGRDGLRLIRCEIQTSTHL